jgi:hypothetical protein
VVDGEGSLPCAADADVPAKLSEQRLEGREEAQALPGRQIVREDILLQLGISDSVEIEVAGQITAQPAVGVLDRALLPGGVGVVA